MSSVARPATGSRRPGTGSSRLRPGSSYRPGTGLRPKTGFQRLSQSTTLGGGSGGLSSTSGGITADKLISRPLTKHGLAAVPSSSVTDASGNCGMDNTSRLRTAMANRTVVDVSDYEIMLKSQQQMVVEECDRLRNKLKTVTKLKRDRIHLMKEKQRIIDETQILEGNLADLNLALDKMRSLFIGSFTSSGGGGSGGSGGGSDLGGSTEDETLMMSDNDLLISDGFNQKPQRFRIPSEEKDRVMGLMNTRLERLREESAEFSAKCDHLSLEKTRLDSEISLLSGTVSKMEGSIKDALQYSSARMDTDHTESEFKRYDSLLDQSHHLNEEIADKQIILRELKNKYLMIHNALVQRDDSVETMAGSPTFSHSNMMSSPTNGGNEQDYVDIPIGITDPLSSPDPIHDSNTIRVNLKGFDSKLTVHNLQNSLSGQKEKNTELEQIISDYIDCLETENDGSGNGNGSGDGEQKLDEIRNKMMDECKQHQSVINELKNQITPEIDESLSSVSAKLTQYQTDFEYMSNSFMRDCDKYEALFEREIKMQKFIDEFTEKEPLMSEEQQNLENDVRFLTDFIQQKKEQQQADDDSSHFTRKVSVTDQLQMKNEQKQNSEQTLKLAKQELEKTKKELAKIEALDRKIPIEMENMSEEKQHLLSQIQSFRNDVENSDNTNNDTDWKNSIKKEFAMKKETLLREKMRSFQNVDNAMASVNKVKSSMAEFIKEQKSILQSSHTTKKKIFSKEMIDFMMNIDDQIDQTYIEIEEIKNEQAQCQSEASYHSQKSKALELVNQINDLLIQEASLSA